MHNENEWFDQDQEKLTCSDVGISVFGIIVGMMGGFSGRRVLGFQFLASKRERERYVR